MPFELLQANVVVLAQEHNPTILHPTFLDRMKIVPKEWKPRSGQVLTTPAVSRISYETGYDFVVTGDRLQVSDQKPTRQRLFEGTLAEFAAKYVRSLPHVKYTAVGQNFFGLLPNPEPGPYIRDSFVVADPLKMPDRTLTGAEVRLSYDWHDIKSQVSIAPSGPDHPDKLGVVVSVNYHHDLDSDAAIEDAIQFLGRQPELANDFIKTAELFLKGQHHAVDKRA